MPSTIGLATIKENRSKSSKLFGSILEFPIIKSHFEPLLAIADDDLSLLDIGANDRNLYDLLSKNNKNVKYFSFDVDKTNYHDFYNIDDIDVNKKFDIITIFEVIEHLTVDDFVYLLNKSATLLNENGVILISTPNVYHPVRFWRDCTHITPFSYDDLTGFLLGVGFSNIKVYRIKGNFKFKDVLRYWFYRPLIKLLGVDFAPGILITGCFR